METPKRGYDDDVTEENVAQTEVIEEEEKETIASPPRRFLGTQYGNRENG